MSGGDVQVEVGYFGGFNVDGCQWECIYKWGEGDGSEAENMASAAERVHYLNGGASVAVDSLATDVVSNL